MLHAALPLTSLISIITVRNEVAKVIFSQACVCPRGGGVSAPRGGVCSGDCLLLEGVCLVWGVSQHALRQTPTGKIRLLLRTVRILLECILIDNATIAEADLYNFCICNLDSLNIPPKNRHVAGRYCSHRCLSLHEDGEGEGWGRVSLVPCP